ncbi:unnamed protein product [Prunus armeniaca]
MNDPRDPVLQRVASSMKKKFDKYWGSFESVNNMIFKYNIVFNRMVLKNVAFQTYFEEIEKGGMKRVGPPSN